MQLDLYVDDKTRVSELRKALRAIERAPALRRGNGIGLAIVGRYRDLAIEPIYIGLYAFTILWIPLVPLRLYLMSGDMSGAYKFYGTISASDFGRIYPDGPARLFLRTLAERVLWIGGISL